MAKKEAQTDYWVAEQLRSNGIDFTPQGSNVKELNEALKTASKRGTGKVGFPEFTAVIGDFVLVIEDKASLDKHVKLDDNEVLASDTKALTDYAVNGAWFYAKHIAENSNFHNVFAVGVSGDEKHHKITPLFVDDRGNRYELDDLESFVYFSQNNIQEYYKRNVLKQETDTEKSTEEILKYAEELHNDLRNYGALKDQDKPLVVAGILLALDEIEHGNFSIDSLKGDQVDGSRDGDKIMSAIRSMLKRKGPNLGPETKIESMLSEFKPIFNSERLNELNDQLKKTPLRYYTESLNDNIYRSIKKNTSEDFIGRFYGEFMSYSGGDGQTLGIVLTPRHITDLMCEILNVGPEDKVIDPCCGTAGFLISAMHRMLTQAESETQRKDIKKKQLYGFEIQSNMFAVAAANMILRKDGNSNLLCRDFLKQNSSELQERGLTVGLMNPPYSQGSKDDPSLYEMSFVEHLLDSLSEGARAAVIVPQSSMTGKTKYEQQLKEAILKKHTLEGVITCNTDTFYGVGTNPVIAVFTAHEPHDPEHVAKFIDFRNDGYEVRAHIGLVEGDSAKDKKQHLLDVWNGKIEAPSKFCVGSTVTSKDEWLHSFYYFNDEIPLDEDFDKAVGEYLAFELSMIMQGRSYLFAENSERFAEMGSEVNIATLQEKRWNSFNVFSDGILSIKTTGSSIDGIRLKKDGKNVVPYITRSDSRNGIAKFVSESNYVYGSDEGGCITVGLDTQTAFWQTHKFVTGQNIQIISSEQLNEYIALFMTVLLRIQMTAKFNWGGNGATLGRMKRLEVMLPINNSGQPDYGYMEQYIRNMMIRKYQGYLDYLNNKSE